MTEPSTRHPLTAFVAEYVLYTYVQLLEGVAANRSSVKLPGLERNAVHTVSRTAAPLQALRCSCAVQDCINQHHGVRSSKISCFSMLKRMHHHSLTDSSCSMRKPAECCSGVVPGVETCPWLCARLHRKRLPSSEHRFSSCQCTVCYPGELHWMSAAVAG